MNYEKLKETVTEQLNNYDEGNCDWKDLPEFITDIVRKECESIPIEPPVMLQKKVWLLTTGSGADGDEWNVMEIYSTYNDALIGEIEYEKPRYREDGSSYKFDANIEEWEVKP